ncbi:OmpL47-type beta-barrel domain-containing protein [Streptomyces atratus]|uniref:OmpL47-type beta-barrel domain-containing protein n=1 Tax=Streptomyces atratus TaxID=1893 RepID=UPI0033E42DF7
MKIALRARLVTFTLAAAFVVAVLPGVTQVAQAASAEPTSCGDNAGSAGFQPVLQLDVPTGADWSNQDVPYSFDDTASVSGGFDRVGYCLETTSGSGTQWVWADMEAFTDDPGRLGLPTRPGQITRQRVDDLDVASNVPGVRTGTGMPGYLEMWPNSYEKTVSDQIADASSAAYDADDVPSPGFYGSFQVHSVGADPDSAVAPSTAFAVNHFTGGGPMDIGMGNQPAGEPDWTFAADAGSFDTRTLTVFARPSTVKLTSAPQDRQLYPRGADNGADVRIAGAVTSPEVDTVRLTTTSEGKDEVEEQRAGDSFSFDRHLTAGLHTYDFTLETVSGGRARTVGHWTDVVSGDVFVIEGQSNAQATAWVEPGSRGEMSPFLRTYGTNDFQPDVSGADREWKFAAGEPFYNQGAVGQWGIRMARVLSEQNKVPVAVINGAHGGAPIGFLQRNDSDPDDISTNYGRLRQRLVKSGTIDKISGVLFYQGESEADNAAQHVTGFTNLLVDWRDDFGGARGAQEPRVYVTQVRTSPCLNSEAVALRDAQRRMPETLDVTVLSPTGLSNHDSCHFGWSNGYKLFGEQVAATLMRDLYDGPSDGVAAPNPVSASFTSRKADTIRVQLASKTDPLTVDPGVGADFRLRGTSAKVTDVQYLSRGRLELKLSAPALDITSLAYVAHNGAGPMIRTSRGVGLLAFDALPVATTPAPDLFDTIVDAVQGLDARAGELADVGDLPAARRARVHDAMAAALADVEAATPDGSDVSTEPQKLIDALTTVQYLHAELDGAGIDEPVLGELDTRLVRLEQLLGRAVSLSLGVRVTIPPLTSTAVPGQDLAGTVQLTNSGDHELTGVAAKVSVDGWDVKTALPSTQSLGAGETVALPFTTTVPKRRTPGGVDAAATITFTTDAGTFTMTESTWWVEVASGIVIDSVGVTTVDGDPADHAVAHAEVSNDGRTAVRGQLVVDAPEGWAAPVPSDPVTIEAGSSASVTAPVVIPQDVVAGAGAVTVRFEREGTTLDQKPAQIPVTLSTPPTGAALDHVDFGIPESETAHALQAAPNSGTNVEAGLTRRYANQGYPGSWFSAEVAVEPGKPFILRNIETFDQARTKKYPVYVDGHLIRTQVVEHEAAGMGTETYDLLVDDPEVLANDGTVRVRYEFPSGPERTFDPSIADLWVLAVSADDVAPFAGATVDSAAPAGDNGWFRGNAAVTIHASDQRDATPTVQVGGADGWQAYSGPVAVTGQGKHSLSYRARDAAGNSTGEQTVDVWIDSTAPSTHISMSRVPGADSADQVAVTLTADDALSGVATTSYRVDGEDWKVLSDEKPVVKGFGSHTVDYFSTDVAGNPEPMATLVINTQDVEVIEVVTPPKVTGPAVIGSTVTATPGTWNTTGLAYAYQWLRDGRPITGATAVARTITSGDAGHRLSVTVTASKAGKSPVSSASAATDRVTGAKSRVVHAGNSTVNGASSPIGHTRVGPGLV